MKQVSSLIGELPTAEHVEDLLTFRAGPPLGLILHHTKGPGSPHRMAQNVVDTGREGGIGHLYTWHHHSGRLFQCWPVDVVTNHAMGYSHRFLSLCVTGDWDARPWPSIISDDLVDLSAMLTVLYGWGDPGDKVHIPGRPALSGLRVGGHREYRWGSRKVDGHGNVTKSCPGLAQNMNAMRQRIRERVGELGMTSTDAHCALIEAGVRIAEGVWP